MSHHNLNLNSHKPSRWDFIKTGLLIAGLAICFLIDRTYFFYPPSLAPAWNNMWVDVIGLLAGVDLILCGVLDINIDILVTLGLGDSVAFLTALLIVESYHIFGAGYFRFHTMPVFEINAIANLMQTAYDYDPQD